MHNGELKVGLVDIETTPNEGSFWGQKWETNIIELSEYSRILSYSWEWLGGKTITRGWPDFKGYKPGVLDDKAIAKELHSLLEEADIIIAHNGRDFDEKVITTRMAYHKLQPTSPYKILDTKVEFKKRFRLPSYSANDICDYFGIGRKLEHEGWPLWKKCMGVETRKYDKSAWNRMLEYNENDVVLLRKMYEVIRPWMRSVPVGLFAGMTCPRPGCGGTRLHAGKEVLTKTMIYKTFQCQRCGGYGRVPKSERVDKPLIAI